jgi:murein DD-endopeptidase MepM/ murein hydrolase activator NlpD
MPEATVFRLPVASKSYTVSSHYGPRCIPVQGGSTYHMGVDMATKAGSPIYAIAAGMVTHTVSGSPSQVGYISVRHSIGGVEHTSIYMHVWSATTHVTVGQFVSAGQQIGEVGSSGVSSGSHLHLEVWRATAGSAAAEDPAAFLKSRGPDVYGSATAVTASATPPTCTYYTTGGVNFRTGPSTSYTVLRMLPPGTAVVHVPGMITAGFIPVSVGTETGWVSASLVTPIKPVATYATTVSLNLRASPVSSSSKVAYVPQGGNVGPILRSSGDWRQVSYGGKSGWVHRNYLVTR